MKKTHTVQINEKLYNNILEYCKLNNLKIKDYINEILGKCFLAEKYGDTPFAKIEVKINKEEEIEKEITLPEVNEEKEEESTSEEPIHDDVIIPIEEVKEVVKKKKVTRLNG